MSGTFEIIATTNDGRHIDVTNQLNSAERIFVPDGAAKEAYWADWRAVGKAAGEVLDPEWIEHQRGAILCRLQAYDRNAHPSEDAKAEADMCVIARDLIETVRVLREELAAKCALDEPKGEG